MLATAAPASNGVYLGSRSNVLGLRLLGITAQAMAHAAWTEDSRRGTEAVSMAWNGAATVLTLNLSTRNEGRTSTTRRARGGIPRATR